jgi:hypothetical protein
MKNSVHRLVVRVIVCSFLMLSTVEQVAAGIIVVNETIDVSGVTSGFHATRGPLTSPVLVSPGDQVDNTVTFSGGKALRIEDQVPLLGVESLWTWLRGATPNATYEIDNIQLQFIGFRGAAGTSSTITRAAETNGSDHLGPTFNDFLAPGQWIEFTGYRVTYDVLSLTQTSFPRASTSVTYEDLQIYTRNATPVDATVVPEPSTLAIFALGGLTLVVGGIRRRKQKA